MVVREVKARKKLAGTALDPAAVFAAMPPIVLIDMPRRRWGAPFFPGTTLRRNWSGRGAERRIFCPFRFDFGGVAGHSGASLRSSGCCKAGPYVQERHLERGGEWNEAKGRPYHDVSEKSTSYIREKMRNFVAFSVFRIFLKNLASGLEEVSWELARRLKIVMGIVVQV